MEILKDKYSITELSAMLKVTDHALRFYEKEFGLHIPKDDRGRRYYTTDLANLMYKIKTMRNEGLEIKAIRKILISDNIIKEPPPVAGEGNEMSLVRPDSSGGDLVDIKQFFDEFRERLATEISTEIYTARDHLSNEISKSKHELGACMDNGMRRLEQKMEKHFSDVDRALGVWREKNRKNIFKKLLSKTIK